MKRFLAVLLAIALLGSVVPASAQQPITAQFWYAFGGKNREVTEAHIKKFNESQSEHRIEGAFQGDYFQAMAKIRAASVTRTAPPILHARRARARAGTSSWRAACSWWRPCSPSSWWPSVTSSAPSPSRR